MTRVALVGLGKMGISHLAILRAHPEVALVGACDGFSYLTRNLERYSGTPCFNNVDEMIERAEPEALLIATPTRSHAEIARNALQRDIAVFCEKPLVLHLEDGCELVQLAERGSLANQVGYHYRFVSTFEKAARVVQSGLLGRVHHARVEAFGPVVVKPQGATWRSRREEGGGVVYDYACHAVDLIHFVVGEIESVDGVIRQKIFSNYVDDEVYASLHLENGASGQLSVNWSDPSHRKMSTKLSVWGDAGSLIVDRQECHVYLQRVTENTEGLQQGWSTFNITDLSEPTDYYLRGEEYSKQIDYFIESVRTGRSMGINSFQAALSTDRVVAMILSDSPMPSRGGKGESLSFPVRLGRWLGVSRK